jgi:hypothetical protein
MNDPFGCVRLTRHDLPPFLIDQNRNSILCGWTRLRGRDHDLFDGTNVLSSGDVDGSLLDGTIIKGLFRNSDTDEELLVTAISKSGSGASLPFETSNVVPEPSSLVLLGLGSGLIAVIGLRRRNSELLQI